jgi:hypothetical protein
MLGFLDCQWAWRRHCSCKTSREPPPPRPPSQAIFLGAAGVSFLATLAFLAFVPSHPNGEQQPQQHAAGQAAGPAAGKPAPAPPRRGLREQAAALWRDVRGMGGAFYRTLAVIGLYGLGHVNESMLEARAIEVRPRGVGRAGLGSGLFSGAGGAPAPAPRGRALPLRLRPGLWPRAERFPATHPRPRSRQVGFGKAEATLVVALLCLSVSLCAYPLGRLDDKHGPKCGRAGARGGEKATFAPLLPRRPSMCLLALTPTWRQHSPHVALHLSATPPPQE